MNLIQVNGVEVMKSFLEICDKMVNTLKAAIHANVLKSIAELNREIAVLIEGVCQKCDSEEKLVETEQRIELIRAKQFRAV